MTNKFVEAKFKDIRIGERFMFAPSKDGYYTNHDVYLKESSRTYQYDSKRMYAMKLKEAQELARIYHYTVPKKLPNIKVGSINARVLRFK